ncbi:hypothetical protein DAMA08_029880 [Martiniozyma asiatica (nom. inval.)]|nr:hypothetical protein DAMA08_029880 [Martiniozyma asiatica]
MTSELNEKIQTLLGFGMGWSEEQIYHALQQTNNNVEMAANWMMDQGSAPPNYNDYTDRDENVMATTSAPISINDETKSYIMAASSKNIDSRPIQVPPAPIHIQSVNKYDIYSDVPSFSRDENNSPVILPLMPDMFESYMAPLIIILGNIPDFRNLLMKVEFKEYGFKPNWWNKEKVLEETSIPLEIQRLFSFMSDSSDRAFASIYNLVEASKKHVTTDIERGSEYISFFFELIIKQFSLNNPDLFEILGDYLNIHIESYPESYPGCPIDKDVRSNDLYKSVHALLWKWSFEYIDQLHITKLPLILNFDLEWEGEPIEGGFNLREKIYPQIYTAEYKILIKNILDQMKILNSEYGLYDQAILDTRVFQGKSIDSFLNSSIEHLSITVNENAVTDSNPNLNEITMDDKYNAAKQSLNMIKERLASVGDNLKENKEFDKMKYENMQNRLFEVESLFQDANISLEPWILSGLIITPENFYFYNVQEKVWIHVLIDEDTCKDFRTEKVTFETVKNDLNQVTREGIDSTIFLTYVKESTWKKTEYDMLNGKLRQFIEEDNDYLEETRRHWLESENYESLITNKNNSSFSSEEENLDESKQQQEKSQVIV